MMALRKDRADRYQSCALLLQDLSAFRARHFLGRRCHPGREHRNPGHRWW